MSPLLRKGGHAVFVVIMSPLLRKGGHAVFVVILILIITIPQQSWESYCFSIVFSFYYYDSPTELGIVLFFYCFLLRFPNRVGNRIVFLLFFIIIILYSPIQKFCQILSRAILINYLMELIETCNIDRWQCELV